MKNVSNFTFGFKLDSDEDYYDHLKHLFETINSMHIGRYSEDGGCLYEFRIEWIMLNRKICFKVNIFDESWPYFGDYRKVLECIHKLSSKSQDSIFSPKELSEKLIKLGLKNLSK